jgi:hypothetical protein
MAPAEIDRDARLVVEESLSGDGRLILGPFAPIAHAALGDRLHVPATQAQTEKAPAEENAGTDCVLELTFAQAMRLSDSLANVLGQMNQAGRPWVDAYWDGKEGGFDDADTAHSHPE